MRKRYNRSVFNFTLAILAPEFYRPAKKPWEFDQDMIVQAVKRGV